MSTTRYVALLRAVNVGGRILKMAELAALLERLGFSEVKTYIQSGNAWFSAPDQDPATRQTMISQAVEKETGYAVPTMVRSVEELKELVAANPFAREAENPTNMVYVTFFDRAPDPADWQRLLDLKHEREELFLHDGRDMVILIRDKVPGERTKFAMNVADRILKRSGTNRNLNTVRKLAAGA